MGKVENEGMPVVRLDRQLKYQGNILKMYEDTVLANGHEAHWDLSITMAQLQSCRWMQMERSLWYASTAMP